MAKLVILLCLVWGAGCKPANQLEPVPVVVAEPTTVCVSTEAGDDSTVRPAFIVDVVPVEGASICEADFIRDGTEAGIQMADWGDIEYGFRSKICIQVAFDDLVEENDDFLSEDPVGRMRLTINGADLEAIPGLYSGSVISYSEALNATYLSGIQAYCWPVKLEKGYQEIQFTFTKSSGESVGYGWAFYMK